MDNCEKSDLGSLIDEVEGYKQEHTLQVVNRDGDLYYVECPECHGVDLHTIELFACRSCHTFFKAYTEDGLITFTVENEGGGLGTYGKKVKLLKLLFSHDTYKILHGRNEHRLSELESKYPELQVITLERDLNKIGCDAHGHSKYKKYALIPLGD
jgi:hypothetical protein